jgi:NAD(P)-dependent dehydrogenase (short-subunit alcohol dehydrogenase family)
LPETCLLPAAAGRTALVTGAAGGIGRAVCALFRAAGMNVAAADLARLEPPAPDYLPVTMDATDEAAVRDGVGRAAAQFGRLDVVVHAVGAVGAGNLQSQSLAEWRRVLDVNLTSAFLVARACYPHLARPGGTLILFSSTNGRNGGNVFSGPAYAVAKAGIVNLVRFLARDWAAEGLRVNCLAPGPVATTMLDRLTPAEHAALRARIPLGRYAEAAEIAAAVAFLASPHAASISGACLNISGAQVLD